MGDPKACGDTLVNWLKNHQGIVSLVIGVLAFWFGGNLIQSIDPTAGRYDTGAIHGLITGSVAYLTAVWLAWMVLQIEWPTLNEHIDLQKWLQDWRVIRPEQRVWFTLAVWGLLFAGGIACLLGWR